MGRNTRNKKDSRSKKASSAPRNNYSSNRNSFSGPREMHKAKCADCSADCEVPFKPTEGKPVFCRECYRKKKSW